MKKIIIGGAAVLCGLFAHLYFQAGARDDAGGVKEQTAKPAAVVEAENKNGGAGDGGGKSESEINVLDLPLAAMENMAEDGTLRKIARAAAGNGNDGVVINFWASWCAPCLREMPLLDEFFQKSGAPLVGIAPEKPAAAAQIFKKTAVTYPLFTADAAMIAVLPSLGNPAGILPYTIVLDGDGRVLKKKIGEFHSVQEIADFAKIGDN